MLPVHRDRSLTISKLKTRISDPGAAAPHIPAGSARHSRLRIRCSNEACRAPFETALPAERGALACPHCSRPHECSTAVRSDQMVQTCPVCNGDELYIRKDFPQRAGLALVVVVAILSFWLFARGDLLWALGILVGVALLDLLVYLAVPRITVCYRCRTEICGTPVNPRHRGFDLATAEKYR